MHCDLYRIIGEVVEEIINVVCEIVNVFFGEGRHWSGRHDLRGRDDISVHSGEVPLGHDGDAALMQLTAARNILTSPSSQLIGA